MKQNRIFMKILVTAMVLTALLGLAAVAYGVNTSSDPLVSLSYLTGTYRTNLLSDVETAVNAESRTLSEDFSKQISDLKSAVGAQAATPAENDFEVRELSSGQTVSVSAGGEVLVLSGSASAVEAGLTDATAGSSVYAGGSLSVNHLYVAVSNCTIKASGAVKLLVK